MSEQALSPLHTCISCAVLQPALRSILIFDAPFSRLEQIAQQMSTLAAEAGQRLRPLVISSAEDDDLWGGYWLPDSHGRLELHRQAFSPPMANGEVPLIILPDLRSLSLAMARTCIMLIGASVAHLERHGQQAMWTPRYYWLASCRQDEVGSISPHLLDRFVLRLAWRSDEPISHQERVNALHRNLQQTPDALLPLAPQALRAIKLAVQSPPTIEIASEVCVRAISYFPVTDTDAVIHQRRELTLGRCAYALAQLAGDTRLRETHLAQAAHLMGITPLDDAVIDERAITPRSEIPAEDPREQRPSPAPIPQPRVEAPTHQTATSTMLEVATPEPDEQPAIDYVISAPNPYPEDEQPVLREAGSLQIPRHYVVGTRADRGTIIGVEPASTLRDLALVNTLMRALLFQAFRDRQDASHIVLDWSDLRKYRRAAEPTQLLLLLLDYTCLPLAQRQRALVPYLSQAYVERASITIIKVGAAVGATKSGLRAEQVSERNILVPAISEALDAASGGATPLAHGLELALQVMRQALQHGRNTVQHITFVVLSDGRGNVPLRASHSNVITPPVTREGIEDALVQAREIARMKAVTSTVLAPHLRYYLDLPQRLANALNAQLIQLADEEGEQL